MSLINDVLRNLDAQRPDVPGRAALQSGVVATPPAGVAATPPRSGRPGRWRGLLVLLVLALAASLWALTHWQALRGAAPGPGPSPSVSLSLAAAPSPVATPASLLAPSQPSAAQMSPGQLQHATVQVAKSPEPAQNRAQAFRRTSGVNATLRGASSAAEQAMPPTKPDVQRSTMPETPHDRAMAELAVAEQLQEQAGMDADVDAHLRTALQIEPTCVPARQLLLRRLAKAQRWDELVDALQQGLAVSPGQVSWALSLARVQYEQGKLGSADGTLAQYQSFADSSAEFADFAGHVKLKLGQNAQAVAQFQRAVRLEPHDGRGWLGLGLALEAAGHRAESQEALQRSLAVGTLSRDLADLAIRHLQH